MPDWAAFVRKHLQLSGVRPEREAEIVEDLARQLEDAYREALAAGASETSARAAAERQISDWAVLSKEVSDFEAQRMAPITLWQERREERDLLQRGHFSWLTDLRQDVLFGLRMLRKTPGVTAVALLALALGIGANAAIFSVINAVLLRPLPYPSSDRIVAVHNLSPLHFVLQPDLKGAWAEWADHTRSFEFLAADETGEVNLAVAGSEPERAAAAEVTQSFFETIGIFPEAGRTFSPQEEVIGHPALAILSDILCRRFGAPRDVVGKTILINGKQTVVIGVMPPSFDYPGNTMLWLPAAWTFRDEAFYGSAFVYRTIGRLKPGISVAQAREELNAIYSRVMSEAAAQAAVAPAAIAKDAVEVAPLHEELAGSSRAALLLLLGAVAFVLLIACADVANIVLARAVATAARNRAEGGAGREPDAINPPGAHGKPFAIGDRRRCGTDCRGLGSSCGAALHSGGNAFRQGHRTRRAGVDFPCGNLCVERTHFRLIACAARHANRSQSTAEGRRRECTVKQVYACTLARRTRGFGNGDGDRVACWGGVVDQEFVAACEY